MRVAIVGMGKSREEFIADICCNGKTYDEVWAINALGNTIKCDKVFLMDDVERLYLWPNYGWLLEATIPVITSKAKTDICPTAEAFPFKDIVKKFGTRYFSNTVAYAIAYALHIGVKEMVFFGCDYDYDGEVHEINRPGTEFWLGIAHAMGVKVGVSEKSSLLNMNTTKSYAYEESPHLTGK